MTAERSGGRVVVLGLDGLEWSVVDALTETGVLPTFREVLANGGARIMASTTPPLTPAAWSTLLSGVPPERHGVFDFTARDAGRYSFRLCTAGDRQAEMLWELASAAGRSVAVLNVPMTFPATAVNGLMVSGMDAPTLDRAVYPPTEAAAVLAISPDYTIDAMSHWFADREVFAAQLERMHRAHHRVALDVWRRRRPDLLVCVFVLADRVQHVGWGDSPTPEVVAAYESLDRAVGDFAADLGPDDTLIIISDHGFQQLRAEVCVNRVLEKADLLTLDRRRCRELLDQHNRRLVHSRGAVGRPFESWWDLPPRGLWFDGVDWPRTRCAAFGLMGNMMLNLKGRDPEGLVEATDVAAMRREVEAAVRASLRSDLGEVDVVAHPVHWDAVRARTVDPPDLVLEIDGYRVGTWGGREFFAPKSVHENQEGHTGVHSPDAVFMATGRGFSAAPERGRADALDVAPTVLDLLGIRPAAGLDGRSLAEL
jgi:predicted AlkP superfamily phosphohydrolase/phosphomutase